MSIVTVPDLVGLAAPAAEDAARAAGCVIQGLLAKTIEGGSGTNGIAASITIASQVPAAGVVLPEASSKDIWVKMTDRS